VSNVSQFNKGDPILPKPVTIITYWQYNFFSFLMPSLTNSPSTPDRRKMTSEDVPSALALVNMCLRSDKSFSVPSRKLCVHLCNGKCMRIVTLLTSSWKCKSIGVVTVLNCSIRVYLAA